MYILYVYFGKGGGGVGEVRKKVEGQQITRGVENTNITDCISSTVYKKILLNPRKDEI
jgi:hypothetical protein